MNDSAICGQEVSEPLGIAPTRGDSPSRKYDVKIERRESNGNITEWLPEILGR